MYTYDKLNRLVGVALPDGSQKQYTYDLRGNRSSMGDDAFIPDLENVSYTYNVPNQLTSVTKGTVTTDFSYNPDGLRYKKASPAKRVMYHYDLAGRVIAEAMLNKHSLFVCGGGPMRQIFS